MPESSCLTKSEIEIATRGASFHSADSSCTVSAGAMIGMHARQIHRFGSTASSVVEIPKLTQCIPFGGWWPKSLNKVHAPECIHLHTRMEYYKHEREPCRCVVSFKRNFV